MEIENLNNNSEDVSMNGNSLIIDVITDNFMTDVIEQSKETPVIVDFWAPWCEPCKQLTPIIERIIKEKNGKVILAKMNIDESPEVAQQLKIQSIPAVMAFNDGQPMDGFIGVQSEKNIIEFVNKISSLKNSSTIEENISAGKKYMNDIQGKAQGISTKASIDALWKLIGNHLPTPQSAANTQWSDHYWGILEKRIFGSSTAYDGTIQLVEMNQKEVREISTENFDRLKNTGVKLCPVYVKSKPGAESPGTIYIMPVYPKGNKKESTSEQTRTN